MVDAGVAAMVIRQHIMVETGVFSTPDASVAVFALGMRAIVHALGEDAPLHGEILISVEGCALVDAPAHGAVVEDDVAEVTPPDAVFAVSGVGAFIAQAEVQIADYDIIRVDVDGVVLETDSAAGGSLAGYGDVAVADLDGGLELDDAGNVEYYSAGAFLADSPAKRPFAAVVQVRDMVNRSPAATGGIHSATLGTGERPCNPTLFICRKFKIVVTYLIPTGCRRNNDFD